MPTLEAGIRNSSFMRISQSEAGFTLIELLVVLFIITTVLSIGMLSFGVLGDDHELQTEAKRFGALLEVAQDEASMQGREFGIELLVAGYRFVEYDTLLGIWVDIPNDDVFRLRVLPEDLEFNLFLEGKRIPLELDPAELENPEKDKKSSRLDTKVYSPHLLVFSSGDATPFDLHIWREWDDRRLVLEGDALGTVKLLDPEDQ
jgi:general secretion pathway protein H